MTSFDILYRRTIDLKLFVHNSAAKAISCIKTLELMFGNIVDHAEEQKFRSIKGRNPRLLRDVLTCEGGEDLLIDVGFQSRVVQFEQQWTWQWGHDDAEGKAQWAKLAEARQIFKDVLAHEAAKEDEKKSVKEKLKDAKDYAEHLRHQLMLDRVERQKDRELQKMRSSQTNNNTAKRKKPSHSRRGQFPGASRALNSEGASPNDTVVKAEPNYDNSDYDS